MSHHGFSDEVQEILSKAAVDRDFREGLLTNPRETIERAFGRSLPPKLRLKFVPKDPDCDAMFVLPDLLRDHELSQDDLDSVSGGRTTPQILDETIWGWGDPPTTPPPVPPPTTLPTDD